MEKEEEEEEEGSRRRVEGRRCRGAVALPWCGGAAVAASGELGRERERYGKGRDGKRERGGEEIFLPSAGTPWPTLAQLPCIGYADTF